MPPALACARSASRSRVLPMPGGPSTSASRPRPAQVSSTSWPSSLSSRSRSSNAAVADGRGMMRGHRQRAAWLPTGLAAALVGGGVASAGAGSSSNRSLRHSFIVTAGCQEHQAFVDGDEGAVAARLPKRYTPVRDPQNGRPLLFVRALRCSKVTIDGRTAPATMASFGIVIESPDGRGCASGAPGVGTVKGDAPPACNWYTLFWLANDRRVIRWLRDGTPGFRAV